MFKTGKRILFSLFMSVVMTLLFVSAASATSLNQMNFDQGITSSLQDKLVKAADSTFLINVKFKKSANDQHYTYDIGSGFLISKNEILTNYHVIETMYNDELPTKPELFVSSPGNFNRTYIPTVAYYDSNIDLAILKLSEDVSYDVFSFAKPSDKQKVYTLGYPKTPSGYYPLMESLRYFQTNQIVTTYAIHINRAEWIKQGDTVLMGNLDAPIEHGNSGGPVLNEEMKVVGIMTATMFNNGIFIHSDRIQSFIDLYHGKDLEGTQSQIHFGQDKPNSKKK